MLIADSRALLLRARELAGDSILVACSGGKDSLATLDLCVQTFPKVAGFYAYLVPDLECVERTLRSVEKRYGITIHRVPHPDLAFALKFGAYCCPIRNGGAQNIRTAKWIDSENMARERSGVDWIALGQRATDSIERTAMLRKLGGLDPKGQRVFPIWQWKPNDVKAYCRAKDLRPTRIRPGHSGDGMSLLPKTLIALKENWPEDYAKVLEIFPYVEAEVRRQQMYGEENDS